MTPDHLKIFLAAFPVGAVWYRIFLRLAPKSYVLNPALRRMLGLQWHHYHHGVILVLVGTIALTVVGIQTWILVFLGLGLGFIMDEFAWSLMMPGNRDLELRIYDRSFRPTFILTTIIIFVGLAISYLTNN